MVREPASTILSDTRGQAHSLINVPRDEGHVEYERRPLSREEEQECDEAVRSLFWDDKLWVLKSERPPQTSNPSRCALG